MPTFQVLIISVSLQSRTLPCCLSSACSAGDPGSIPESGKSPERGNSNTLQYSCLGSPLDRGPRQGPWGGKESHTAERLTHTGLLLDNHGKDPPPDSVCKEGLVERPECLVPRVPSMSLVQPLRLYPRAASTPGLTGI